MAEEKIIRVSDLEKIYQARIIGLMRKGDSASVSFAGAVHGCLRIAKELVPAADAVAVVRCKDCVFNTQRFAGGVITCRCPDIDQNGTGVAMFEDDFCSYGKRNDA